MSDNPLNNIFTKDSSGKLTNEIDSIKNIHYFFDFIKNDKIKEDTKIKVLDEFKTKLHNSRYISEYFSFHENKSIYIYLFDLYINKSSNEKLKKSIQSLIEELCLNITTGKEVYEYLFQKLAKIYKGEIQPTSNNVYNILKLISSVLCEIDSIVKPKNYFACPGNGKFVVELKENPVEVSYSFTINVNFKLNIYEDKNPNKNRVSNLIKIFFSNKKELSIDLKYPCSLIIKEIRNDPIKVLSNIEWINLNITITNFDNKINLFINASGENNPTPFKLSNFPIKFDDRIEKIEFFNNFYGEVTSIYMFSQKDSGPPGVNSTQYLSELKNYTEGLWKKKLIDNFIPMIQKIYSVDAKSKSIYFKSTKIGSKEDKKKTLLDNIVFIFTPINYSKKKPDIVEDIFTNYQLKFSGNIKNHLYINYQKQLLYVSELNNFFPIAEMFLIYPETLDEKNLELFLEIISNVLNYRKQNLKNIKQYKFFNVLSMFIEKYPQKIFTQRVLNAFYKLAKTLFINNNYESICSNYFKHILLNEKILSKYNINLQIEFWNQLFLFCQSDITQIETFININRLCLILRFYDRNKYTEMCCEEHLNMIKDEYVGSKKIMNPTMMQKLSNLKNIMDLIIESQEPKNAVTLFKLLTLDLSPCLVKFILNIFIHAFQSKSTRSEDWKDKFVDQLLQSKYEVIVINTFIHSLPDIRIELLKFVYQVHLRLIASKTANTFKSFEKMIKTCLLPDKMFYGSSSHKSTKINTFNNTNNFTPFPKKEEPKKFEPKKEEIKKPEPKKFEPKKEEIKKPEPKKEEIKKFEQKKPELKKTEPKKEEPKPAATGGGAKPNFLALLSKFDKPKNTPASNNDLKKSLPIKKDNPLLKSTSQIITSNTSNQKINDISKKSLLSAREEILKKNDKKQENLPTLNSMIQKPKEEKQEKKNSLAFSTNPFLANKASSNATNTSKSNFSSNVSNFEKKVNNPSTQNKLTSTTPSGTVSTSTISSSSNKNNKIDNHSSNFDHFSKINSDGEEIIIKDSEIDKYIKKLYSCFMLWSMNYDIDDDFDKINLEKSNIKVINTIEIIFLLNNIIKNKQLILKFLKSMNKLVEKPENCFEIFFNKKSYASFLDLTFDNYKKTGKDEEEIFNLGKNILISLFINSLIFCEKQPNLNPGNEIETILLWGLKVLEDNSITKEKKNTLFEFLFDLFFECLLQFKIKFEVKIKIDSKNINSLDIEKNFALKNYLMFITEMYIYIFRYKKELDIQKKGISFLYPSTKRILLPELVSSMRMDKTTCNDIAKDWLDFPLIYDLFNRYKFIWVKNNIYKKLNVDKYKNNKSEKYDYIIENIILEKDRKNSFQKELTLLCFEDKKGDYEYIIPLIEIFLKTMMYILELLKNTKNEKDFKCWLKDLKNFIRFIIIASCTLLKSNQSDFYKSVQEKCIQPIAAGLCFLHNLLQTSSICKPKIEKSLNSLFLLCFKIIKCQYNYDNKHKKFLKILKQGSNDLGNSALIQLFNEYIKDNSGNPFMSFNRIESIPLDDNSKYISAINALIKDKEFINAFFENENLKKKNI